MNDKIREMLVEIEEMKKKLGEEIAKQEEKISYEIHDGYVRFEKDVLEKILNKFIRKTKISPNIFFFTSKEVLTGLTYYSDALKTT